MKFAIAAFLWMLALLAVWEKVDVYRTGYAIEQLRGQKKQMLQEQRMLELEWAKSTAPEQLERLASSKLGLLRPRSDQVVLVSPRSPQPGPSGTVSLPVVHTALR
jgi:cell division protein FtsL